MEIELCFAPSGSDTVPSQGPARNRPTTRIRNRSRRRKSGTQFVFDDTPLPVVKPVPVDASVHFTLAEVKLGTEVLRDVDGTLRVDGGQLTLVGTRARQPRRHHQRRGQARARGRRRLPSSASASPPGTCAPALEAFDPKDAPPTNVEASLRVRGATARQMASLANGRIPGDAGARQAQERCSSA